MTRRLTLGLIAVFALAAPAQATTREYPASLTPRAYDDRPGPVFAGDDVVWSDRAPDQSIRVMSARGTAAPRAILTHGPVSGRSYWAIDVAAAPGRVAISSTLTYVLGTKDVQISTPGTRSVTGPPSGPLTRFGECNARALTAVSERALLTLGCVQYDPQLVLRRLGPNGIGEPDYSLGYRGDMEPQAAGRFVAWREKTMSLGGIPIHGIYVKDLDDDDGSYAVALGDGEARWALQADGKIAVLLLPRSGGCSIGWASPSDPTLRPAASSCNVVRLRMAGDRIAYRAAGSSAIILRGLDGAETFVPVPPTPLGEFDFDGSRVAYGLGGCGRDRVVVQDLGDPPPAASEAGPCRAVPTARTIRIPTNRLIRFPVTCPTGCRGTVVIRGHRPCKTCGPLGFASTPLVEGFVDVPAQGSATVVARVPRRIMARFSCRATLEGSASLVIRQPTGDDRSPAAQSKRLRFVIDRQQGCPKRPR